MTAQVTKTDSRVIEYRLEETTVKRVISKIAQKYECGMGHICVRCGGSYDCDEDELYLSFAEARNLHKVLGELLSDYDSEAKVI